MVNCNTTISTGPSESNTSNRYIPNPFLFKWAPLRGAIVQKHILATAAEVSTSKQVVTVVNGFSSICCIDLWNLHINHYPPPPPPQAPNEDPHRLMSAVWLLYPSCPCHVASYCEFSHRRPHPSTYHYHKPRGNAPGKSASVIHMWIGG